jgi:tetratricopeptide (TPR) repeat protein
VLVALGGAITSLRKRLGESLASIQKYDVPVTEATTSSLEALRAYGMANKTRATKGDEAAAPFFQQAIDKDPNFALAYAKLGVVYSNIGRVDDAAKLAAKAYKWKDRVSEYERLYITWNWASRVTKDDKLTRETLELMTASYPRDFAARNNLGVYYIGHGQFEEALKEYQAAIDIAPDEPLPVANATYALLFLGRFDEAFQMADRSLAIRPNGGLAITRWTAAVLHGDGKAAEFETVARKMATPDQMLLAQADLALWHGRLADYGKVQDQLRTFARSAHNDTALASIDAGERLVRAAFQRGKYLDDLRASMTKSISPTILAQSAAMLATVGLLDDAKAALPRLDKESVNNQQIQLSTTVIRAYVKAAEGHAKEGISDIEAVLHEVPRALDLNFHIGQVRERSGDLAGAADSYRLVVKAMPVLGLNPVVSAARLSLGALLVKQGDTAGAKEVLDALIAQWKDADSEFYLLKRAQEERAKIK